LKSLPRLAGMQAAISANIWGSCMMFLLFADL
jgi:hypothetical protein